jgi:hypothetical protein
VSDSYASLAFPLKLGVQCSVNYVGESESSGEAAFSMWLPIRMATAATIPVQGIGGDDAFPETFGRESPDRLANVPPGVQRKLSATDPKTTRDSSHGHKTVGEIATTSVNIKHQILALDPRDDSRHQLAVVCAIRFRDDPPELKRHITSQNEVQSDFRERLSTIQRFWETWK